MQIIRKLVTAGALALALVSSGAARADTCCTGFYITGLAVGGGQFIYDIESTGPVTGNVNKDHTRNSGGGGGLAFGYDFNPKFKVPIRAEIEYVHIHRYDYDRRPVFTNNLAQAGIENNINSNTILLNVNYDFHMISSWWRPYVGASIGYARTRSHSSFNNGAPGGVIGEEEFRTHNLAYGGTIGANLDITPNWYFEAAYKFLDTGSFKAGNTQAGVILESDSVYRHDLRLGFGYRF